MKKKKKTSIFWKKTSLLIINPLIEFIIYPEVRIDIVIILKSTNAVPSARCIALLNPLLIPILTELMTTGPGGVENNKPVIIPTKYDTIIHASYFKEKQN